MKRSSPKKGGATNKTQSIDLKLDRIDRKILNILQKNNKITNVELAELVHLSAPPCLRRVHRLRDLGVIKDVAIIDPFKAGKTLTIFVSITLELQRETLLEAFEKKMLAHDEVKQCYFVSGDIDYILVVQMEDMNHYHEFSRRVFSSEENIRSYRSVFCLNRVKYDTSILLPED